MNFSIETPAVTLRNSSLHTNLETSCIYICTRSTAPFDFPVNTYHTRSAPYISRCSVRWTDQHFDTSILTSLNLVRKMMILKQKKWSLYYPLTSHHNADSRNKGITAKHATLFQAEYRNEPIPIRRENDKIQSTDDQQQKRQIWYFRNPKYYYCVYLKHYL